MSYPCTKCGCCCKMVGKMVQELEIDFPYAYDANGKCSQLADDNTCMVYEDRPLICNIDKMAELLKVNKAEFYDININACNDMMDEQGAPLEYRIKT